MKRFMTFTLVAVATVGLTATAWSQAGQAGGAGGAGGAAGAGANTSGSAGAGQAGTAGATGNVGNAGAAGNAGNAGAPGAAGAAGVGGTTDVGAPGAGANVRPGGARGNSARANGGKAAVAGRASARQNRLGTGANGDRFQFNGINQTPFFNDPGARQQLGLNENQFNTLNRAYQDAYGRYNQGLGGLNNNLTEQQRMQQMQQLEGQFNQSFGQNLNSTFTDPQMRSRFDQLNRQYMGFNAFNDQAIQQQLNLTPQQQLQIRKLAGEWRKQMQQATRGNGTDSNAQPLSQEQWSQMQSQFYDQLNSVFTPEQQQNWTQLTGQRYNFPPNAYLPPDNQDTGEFVNPGTGDNNRPGTGRPIGATTKEAGNQSAPQVAPQGTDANAGTNGGAGR